MTREARRPLPIVATGLVAAAVALMIWLGFWQLRRLHWKEGLLARYAVAQHQPPVGFPRVPTDQALLFRRSAVFCLQPVDWRATFGRSRAGEPGWRHIADCRTGAEGPGVAIDMGWSRSPAAPSGWRGGAVAGIIGADPRGQVLLVAETPAPGLAPSAPPSLAEVPNNHLAYAVQWFVFAGVALLIYTLALMRRRGEGRGDPPQ